MRNKALSILSFCLLFYFFCVPSFVFADNNQADKEVTYKIEGEYITLQWGEKPSSGYHISIHSLFLDEEKTLFVYYQLQEPKKDDVVLTVITYPTVSKKLPNGSAEEIKAVELFNVDDAFELVEIDTPVPINKTWTITFNYELNPETITNESLFVLDSKGNKLTNFIVNDGRKNVTILPPTDNYATDETYVIYITPLVTSKSGKSLNTGYQIPFSVTMEGTPEQNHGPMSQLSDLWEDNYSFAGTRKNKANKAISADEFFIDINEMSENHLHENSFDFEQPPLFIDEYEWDFKKNVTPSIFDRMKSIFHKLQTPIL